MKEKLVAGISILGIGLCLSWAFIDADWLKEEHKQYALYYTEADKPQKAIYTSMVDKGISKVDSFFGATYKHPFKIVIHPGRRSLDSTWRINWKQPDFKSECWMVASGVGNRLDIIAPAKWKEESCEHSLDDTMSTQQLITHELFHVYHGQNNPSEDFDSTNGIDWFVEGLATYSSGQLNDQKIYEVKNLINNNKVPSSLSKFWTGPAKYSLSGSMVMYIDKSFGRARLKSLLMFPDLNKILKNLGKTEPQLVDEWRQYMSNK